jgi:hypothetical protein
MIEDHAVVEQLTRLLAEVGERARARMDRLGDLDAASQDVLVGVVRSIEQQLWMGRARRAPVTAPAWTATSHAAE